MVDPVGLLVDTLRFGEADEDGLQRAWRAVRTEGLARLIAYEQCEIWLYRRLKTLELLDGVAPALADWLAKRARGITARNLIVDAQMSATVRALNDLGVPHVILKGAARRLLAAELPYADARWMSDVDVLVPADLARSTWDAFAAAGYRVAFDPALTPKEHYHLLPVVNDLSVVVEIHSSTSNDMLPEEAWRRQAECGRAIETPGGPTRVPEATELFWHGLTHGLRHGVDFFRLRYLLDVSSIWASGQPIDWDLLRARFDGREIEDVASARIWLGAAAWLAGRTVDDHPFGPLSSGHLRRLLRWRLAVLRRLAPTGRSTEKLLEESVRAEFGLPVAPLHERTDVLAKVRRRTASTTARVTYLAWRTVSGGSSAP
jgi:Uncharacterised nucleotidyltransferase